MLQVTKPAFLSCAEVLFWWLSFLCGFLNFFLSILFVVPVVLLEICSKLDWGEGVLVKTDRKGKEAGLTPALKNEIKC